MDIRERILLPLARLDGGEDPPHIDLAALFLHLLLFDTVVVRTKRLLEFAALAKALGIGRTLDLLGTGCIQVRAEFDLIGVLPSTQKDVVELVTIFPPDAEEVMSTYLQSLRGVGPLRDVKKLKLAVLKRWVRPQLPPTDLDEPIREALLDAVNRTPPFLKALEMTLQLEGFEGKCPRESIHVDQLSPSVIRFRTKNLGAPDELKIVRGAVLAVAHLNTEFRCMKRDRAVTALADDSIALLQTKLDFLWEASNPERRVEQFHRVITAAGLPDFDTVLNERGLNVDAFMKVRESDECRQFRTLLNRSSAMTDTELAEHISSVRGRIGDFFKTSFGKSVRLLATTAAGLAAAGSAGLAAGVVAGATDSFILEKLFPTTGAVTFINKQYPTIFKD